MNIALVIIDMQNDFVLPEAPLCVKGAQATVPTIQKLLDRARAEGWRVIHVIRQHRRDGSDVEIGRAPLFTQGAGICVPGTKGAEIVDELAPLPDETILRKLRFSAFFQTELDMILRRLKIDTLLIAGTQYPNCVRGTATDAMSHDYNEVCLLLDEPYSPEADLPTLKGWLRRLAENGPKTVVATSVPLADGQASRKPECTSVLAYERDEDRFWRVDCSYIPAYYPGTGDVFASVLTGSLLQGDSLAIALDRAVQFVTLGIRATFGQGLPNREGILLERILDTLRAPLGSYMCRLVD